MDLKTIGIGALVNIALTIFLSLIFFPLFFIGPIFGGFLASYLSIGYEIYDRMDRKDGAIMGAISGLIGGLIIGLLFFLGFGDINTIMSSKIGIIGNNTLILGYIIIQSSLIVSFILGSIGGVIGVIVKE
jgi:hypothetical protein